MKAQEIIGSYNVRPDIARNVLSKINDGDARACEASRVRFQDDGSVSGSDYEKINCCLGVIEEVGANRV